MPFRIICSQCKKVLLDSASTNIGDIEKNLAELKNKNNKNSGRCDKCGHEISKILDVDIYPYIPPQIPLTA